MTRAVLSVMIVLTMGVLAFLIAQGQAWMVDRDFFTYWGGGRGVLSAANIYDRETWSDLHRIYGSTWLENPVFIYAPPTAIFFAPFAALSIQAASAIWVWLGEIFALVAVAIVAKEMYWTWSIPFAAFWGIGFALFLPVMLTLLVGQASALLLIIVVATAILWRRGRWLAGGLLFSLTMLKPQPVVLLIPTIALWLALNRRWNALLGIALGAGAGSVASLLFFPNFIRDWQTVALSKVGGVAARMPTLWGLSSDLFGASLPGFWIAMILTGLAVAASVFLVARLRDGDALALMSVLLIISLMVTPYLWNYDQILLLVPLLFALIRLRQRGVSFRAIVWLPLALDVVVFVLFGVAAVRLRDTYSVFIPAIVGFLLWVAMRDRSRAGVPDPSDAGQVQ